MAEENSHVCQHYAALREQVFGAQSDNGARENALNILKRVLPEDMHRDLDEPMVERMIREILTYGLLCVIKEAASCEQDALDESLDLTACEKPQEARGARGAQYRILHRRTVAQQVLSEYTEPTGDCEPVAVEEEEWPDVIGESGHGDGR